MAAIRSNQELVLRRNDGDILVTTHEIIAEEKAILDFLAKSKSIQLAINPWYQVNREMLDDDQRAVVEAVLQTTDTVIAIEGKAGTGKSTLMREAAAGMSEAAQNLLTFAPTSQAVKVLKNEGFKNSETIQQLLINPELQNQTKDAVLWIDEAGLLSTREMKQLFEIAEKQHARIILSGDRYQHHSVLRGDAFRLVVESGEITVKQTRNIHRQRSDAYKAAVAHLSNGNIAEGIAALDEMGAIREVADLSQRLKAQAAEYAESSGSVLAISPTHFEGRLLTTEIRKALKEQGKLTGDEIEIPIHRSRNLTEAEKQMPQFYEIGNVIRFHQNAKNGFTKGDVLRVSGQEILLDFALANRFGVFDEQQIKISIGEKLRITQNTKSKTGKRLFNGAIHEVTAITKNGDLILDGKHCLNSQSGMLEYGYVTTSHSSQGKTAGKVIISQTSLSAGAASMEQFYVSASRGRDEIVIFTDDKTDLLENIGRPSQRMFARELASEEEEITASQGQQVNLLTHNQRR